MNRALLNPFEVRDLPKTIEQFLEQHEKATCMRFNRHGNLLAVGTRAGTVIVWDFDTHSIATTLGEPADSSFPVSSVSFPAPRNGSNLLVSYQPGVVRLYDTLSATVITQVSFDIPIIAAVPHPKLADVVIVVPKDSHPVILHFKRGLFSVDHALFSSVTRPDHTVRVLADKGPSPQLKLFNSRDQSKNRPKNAFGNSKFADVPGRCGWLPLSVLCAADEFVDGKHVEGNAARRKSPYCVTFTRGGRYILRGGPAGIVRAFRLTAIPDAPGPNFRTAECVSVVTVQGKAAVRSIQLSRRDEKVLINSQDRALRLFSLDQLVSQGFDKPLIEPKTTFTEIVNKSQCQSACFSRDGDFVLGGMEGTDHRIHVWRTADGFLDLTLEGPREGILEILWHPLRPVIASLGSGVGGVYVWMKNFTENWSAFAAEFNELEANEEYKEAEDEFDLKDPEDDEKRLEAREKAEANDVDIETVDVGGWFSSDSDEEDTFFYIPAVPKPDPVTEYPSLADKIITEKMTEAKEEDSDIEDVELAGQDGERGSWPPGKRKKLKTAEAQSRQKRPKPFARRRPSSNGPRSSLLVNGAHEGLETARNDDSDSTLNGSTRTEKGTAAAGDGGRDVGVLQTNDAVKTVVEEDVLEEGKAAPSR